jgi:DNA polymerase III delta prime subunit
MEQLDLNKILNRKEIENNIKNLLIDFEKNKKNLTIKRGFYIYGDPGSGKTCFVKNILKDLDYDSIIYDAGDIRNRSIIETITKHNMGDKNILSLMKKKAKPITIVMDEIDGMNSGDKGGINALIKLIRPKKTKKQLGEEITYNPIICISNYHVDKKIKELMKVCNIFELKAPTNSQILDICKIKMPIMKDGTLQNITTFIQGDLRKWFSIYEIYKNNPNILDNNIVQKIFKPKSYNEDTKHITKLLINEYHSMKDHLTIMNDTDRTIVGLLWHENIIDVIEKNSPSESVPQYNKFLDNLCYADYIDRITFQKQIWQFNEMSSLIKTMYNNNIYHDTNNNKKNINHLNDVRFTKVLTKYSTEYNNSLFIQNLCLQLGLDRKDLFTYFLELKQKHEDFEIYDILDQHDIGKLDVNRIYRYLDNYIVSSENTSE